MKNEERLEKIATILVEWYKNQGRKELPWRKDKNPYAIWISEIMLQQTKIEAVKKYYTRFMEALPTVHELANIEEEKLLKLWEGLGYYSRARNLKKAAMIIEENFQGKIPTKYEQLISLPGIGDYTAGAIASIAFDEQVPAVDGNVLRVISRIIENKEDVLLPATKKKITNLLHQCMPKQAGDFNEGLMELGELICIPNGTPLCSQCPVGSLCLANINEKTSEIPVRQKKMIRKKEDRTVLILSCQGKIAIQKRDKKGLLADMYQFPNILGKLTSEALTEILREWKLEIVSSVPGLSYRHIFTHIEWDMVSYIVEVKEPNQSYIWVEKDEILHTFPIPTAFSKFKKNIK